MKSDLGWGKTTSEPKDDRSNVLLEVELSILDCNAVANISISNLGYKIDCTNDTIVAAGYGKGTCGVKD